MLIAIPSEAPGGLESQVSSHFGRCAAFTLVDVSGGQIREVTVLPNDHDHGGCMGPVRMLKDQDVSALIVGGIGGRPLAGFQEAGIGVYRNPGAATVTEVAQLMAAGKCEQLGPAETCDGGCGGHGHGHHHHRDVERPAIEGVADVCDDRVVSIHFTLTDRQGEVVESTGGKEPIRYLHGHGNLPPGLERALTGLLAGHRKVVEVPAAEAYGDYDAARVLEVPRGRLPLGIEVGTVICGEDEHGGLTDFVVAELTDTVARLDANHPLAGKDLVFDVSIVSVEAATEAELEHGHPH